MSSNCKVTKDTNSSISMKDTPLTQSDKDLITKYLKQGFSFQDTINKVLEHYKR